MRCMLRSWRGCTAMVSALIVAARDYMDAIMALPAWNEWRGAALKEPWIMKGNEPDWPLVRGVAVS